MSYILDALKKAQAERELGRVPQIADLSAGSAPTAVPARRLKPIAAMLTMALLLVVAAAATWFWTTTARSSMADSRETQTTAPPSATPRAQAAVPPPQLPPPEPSPPQPATPQPAAGQRLAVQSQPASAPTSPPIQPSVAAIQPAPSVAAAAASGVSSLRAPASAEVVALDALDPALRSRLPPLVAGGAVYSPQREQRAVILDGQVLREGESLTPDVSVQRIEPQGVVLRLSDRLGARLVRLKP